MSYWGEGEFDRLMSRMNNIISQISDPYPGTSWSLDEVAALGEQWTMLYDRAVSGGHGTLSGRMQGAHGQFFFTLRAAQSVINGGQAPNMPDTFEPSNEGDTYIFAGPTGFESGGRSQWTESRTSTSNFLSRSTSSLVGRDTSRSVRESRVPTAEEFMLDFDNAFLGYVGSFRQNLTDEQFAALRGRRDELLDRYVAGLAQLAAAGANPFVRSTRSGEVVSESERDYTSETVSTGEDTSRTESGETGSSAGGSSTSTGTSTTEGTREDESNTVSGGVEETILHDVETDAGPFSAGAFLVPVITPTQFLSELLPTRQAVQNFAEGPDIRRDPLRGETFAGETRFRSAV